MVAALPALAFLLVPSMAVAQEIPSLGSLLPEGAGSASARMIQFIALITVLSIAPGLLIMVTSFTRFVVALSFLRSGLGLQTTPANLVLISLALFMTFFVMQPTFDRAWQEGIQPLTENRITEQEAYAKITDPFREFMLSQVREKDLKLFADLAGVPPVEAGETVELRILVPAYMISELRRGFEIGFLIALPFLVIDMIVATLVMSMGMMMMPPTVIALPFKILFFVLIDGWNLLVGSLVKSFF
ncbi:flagellar type III secretion system pore protein FliP [Amorphus sp. 3PC139-8]|uniref:flagellar type III secretion system pore protein FliP n=1 Tax=Amorphus sp. 3PC139-8 TaxID=2735676 RepID=UPI00345DB3D2